MSIDKLCEICGKNPSKYLCPKCNIAYCSSDCYSNTLHVKCSEEFFQVQVLDELKNMSINKDLDAKRKMVRILKKEYNEQNEDDNTESDLNNLDEEFIQKDLDMKKLNDENLFRAYETEINKWKPWWHNTKLRDPLVQELNDVNNTQYQSKSRNFNSNLVKNSAQINIANASDLIYDDILEMCYLYFIVANIYQLSEEDDSNLEIDFLKEIVTNLLQMENLIKKQQKSNKYNDLFQKLDILISVLQTEENFFLRNYISKQFLVGLIDDLILVIQSPDIIIMILSKLYDIIDPFSNQQSKQLKTDSKKQVDEENDENNEMLLNVFHFNKQKRDNKLNEKSIKSSKKIEIIKRVKSKENYCSTRTNIIPTETLQSIEFGKKEAKLLIKKLEYFFKWSCLSKPKIKCLSFSSARIKYLNELKQKAEAECQIFEDEKKFINENMDIIKKGQSKLTNEKLIEEL